MFGHFLQGLRKTKSFSVWSVRSHRVDRIRNHNDSRANRYSLAHEPIGITRAIVILVMVPNVRLHSSSKLRNCAREISTTDWMGLHQHPFFWCKTTGFSQKGRKILVDLADVME